jgi:hypothetical protein
MRCVAVTGYVPVNKHREDNIFAPKLTGTFISRLNMRITNPQPVQYSVDSPHAGICAASTT